MLSRASISVAAESAASVAYPALQLKQAKMVPANRGNINCSLQLGK